MRSYLYSIFVRFYLAFSGLVVFIVTAILFGAEGRGTIGYGTSLFAIVGIIFSANLGRTFLALTRQRDELKKDLLRRFLILNLALTLVASTVGLTYWYFSSAAREILSLDQAIFFSMTTIFYVWSINGSAFYASFLAIKRQENIILITRTCLIFFLGFIYFNKTTTLENFIVWYSVLLSLGSLIEIIWLYRNFASKTITHVKEKTEILKESLFHHLDFLSFNLFPLVLTVLLAKYVAKSEVGRFNFALQIINLIFLFSTTANIRLTTYVSDVGFRARMVQYKKLFWATLAVSAVSVICLSLALMWATTHTHFEQFQGAEWYFLICGLAVPGYILYQFFSPIWIELRKQKVAATIHALNFCFFLCLAPYVLSNFKLMGAVGLFSSFHIGLIITQGYLYFRYAKN